MTTATFSRARYIPWLFVAGFAVVVGVNAIMVWFAVGSFSGLYAHKARDRGLHYNDVMAERRARDALGWRVETAWQPQSGRFELTAVDAGGAPLAGAEAFVELIRPAEKRPPLPLSLHSVGDGRFAGQVDLPARGNWDADIVILARGQRFALTRRMFLK